MKPVAEARLPPLTAALMLEVTGMEVTRDVHGMNWCRDRGIGAKRKKLGKLPATCESQEREPFVRDQVRALLYEICRVCPHKTCKMRDW